MSIRIVNGQRYISTIKFLVRRGNAIRVFHFRHGNGFTMKFCICFWSCQFVIHSAADRKITYCCIIYIRIRSSLVFKITRCFYCIAPPSKGGIFQIKSSIKNQKFLIRENCPFKIYRITLIALKPLINYYPTIFIGISGCSISRGRKFWFNLFPFLQCFRRHIFKCDKF